ncbi:hypothetical protein H4I96_12064 [Botrytis cinerea]
MNTSQPLGIQHRKRNPAAAGICDGFQNQNKILCSQIEAENDKCDEYNKETTEMTEMMEMLKLAREKKVEKQIQHGNWVIKYRCESCSTTIGSEGTCEKCGENKKERKRDLPENCKICEDWLDGTYSAVWEIGLGGEGW